MNRQEKQNLVVQLRNEFERNSAAFLVTVQGLPVDALQELRKTVRKEGGGVQVARNTLVRIAVKEFSGIRELSPYLKQQIAIVFAARDAAAVAKAVCDFEKKYEKVTVVAGCYEQRVMDRGMVSYLGTLPPREVVIAKACGALKAPLANHVGLLHQLIARLMYVLKQASEKQS